MLCLVAEVAAMRDVEVAVLGMVTIAYEDGPLAGRIIDRLESQIVRDEKVFGERGLVARKIVIEATNLTAFGLINAVGLSLSAVKSGLSTAMAMGAIVHQGLLRGTISTPFMPVGAATTLGRGRSPSRHAKACRSPVAVGLTEVGLTASPAIRSPGPTTRRPRMAIVHAVGVQESP